MELIINWFYENSWVLNSDYGITNLLGGFIFLGGINIILQSFTYPFVTKYGSLLYSITRRKNEKYRSGIIELIIGFACVSIAINPLIKIALIILFIDGLLSFLDSGRDRM